MSEGKQPPTIAFSCFPAVGVSDIGLISVSKCSGCFTLGAGMTIDIFKRFANVPSCIETLKIAYIVS